MKKVFHLKVMMVAVVTTTMLLASSVDNSAKAGGNVWVFKRSYEKGGIHCDSIHGFCPTEKMGTSKLTPAELADHYGYLNVDLNSFNQVHMVFQDTITSTSQTNIPLNYFIGSDASHALGYDSVILLAGTYPVIFTTYTQYGEATFNTILKGPRTNTPVASDCFPPSDKQLTTSTLYKGNVLTISGSNFKNFSGCIIPPSAGSSLDANTGYVSGSINGNPFTAPFTIQYEIVANSSSLGPNYEMEILQLDISGGDLPPGVKIRESPTKQSSGQTNITSLGGGQYRIYSFFDVFTELSEDGGLTWQASLDPPAHLEMEDDVTSSSIPTLSEWGLIALSVLVICMGIFFVRTKFA